MGFFMKDLPQRDLCRCGGAPKHDRHGRRLGPAVHRHHLFHKDVDFVLLEVRREDGKVKTQPSLMFNIFVIA